MPNQQKEPRFASATEVLFYSRNHHTFVSKMLQIGRQPYFSPHMSNNRPKADKVAYYECLSTNAHEQRVSTTQRFTKRSLSFDIMTTSVH